MTQKVTEHHRQSPLTTAPAVRRAVVLSRPADLPLGDPTPALPTAPSERGDLVLAAALAAQAQQVAGQDPQAAIGLLLAAHIVAPDRAEHRVALARRLLAGVEPSEVLRATLNASGAIGYATLSSDASFLLTSGAGAAQVWQARWPDGQPRIRLVRELDAVSAADGAGTLTRTNFVFADMSGASSVWRVASPQVMSRIGELDTRASAVAVTEDGMTAVTVDNTAATLWNVGMVSPELVVALQYDRPVTALSFAGGPALVLAVGHADGGVTVHTINLDGQRAAKRALTGGGRGPVDAVALSADASTVLAVHQDGAVSVWNLRSADDQPAAIEAQVGSGPHSAWVSDRGDYAFISDVTGASLWSLTGAGPAQPRNLSAIANLAVPAMISADGRMVVSIDRNAAVLISDISPITQLLADPVGRACEAADLDETRWRQMVSDPGVANPCAGLPLPTLGVDDASPR